MSCLKWVYSESTAGEALQMPTSELSGGLVGGGAAAGHGLRLRLDGRVQLCDFVVVVRQRLQLRLQRRHRRPRRHQVLPPG